ncbi:MAG: hypothetical protein K0R14_151 [Burkholderiales bacterium]|jgi:opacity protein-like surface antigen|nr:hypothetical protein [Burkholderiales bacterium]
MKMRLFVLSAGLMSMAVGQAYIDLNVGYPTTWDGIGVNVNGGYMFNDYLGVEGGIMHNLGFTMPDAAPFVGYTRLDAAAKGVLPLASVFALYGKLGVGSNTYHSWEGICPWCSDASNSNVGLFIAAGTQFNFSKTWSLNFEYSVVTGPNPGMLMFGGQFNF